MNMLHVLLLLWVLAGIVLRFRDPVWSTRIWLGGLLCMAAAVMVSPFIWLASSVFKDPDVLMEYAFLPPLSEWSRETLNLRNIRELFTPRMSVSGPVGFHEYVFNSLFLSASITMLQLFFASLGGFALAQYRFPGQRIFLGYMLATMMVPPILLLAPQFTMIHAFGWMDTYRALLMPGAVSVFGIFLFRQAMKGLPGGMLEAARVDGCSEFGIYWSLALPLVRPMSAAFCLVSFLNAWNQFINPQIYLHSQEKLTLPVVLNQYMGVYQQQYGVFLAGTLLAILPPAILFFSLEKEFVGGLTQGAIKE